jgi:hypothetical protein
MFTPGGVPSALKKALAYFDAVFTHDDSFRLLFHPKASLTARPRLLNEQRGHLDFPGCSSSRPLPVPSLRAPHQASYQH